MLGFSAYHSRCYQRYKCDTSGMGTKLILLLIIVSSVWVFFVCADEMISLVHGCVLMCMLVCASVVVCARVRSWLCYLDCNILSAYICWSFNSHKIILYLQPSHIDLFFRPHNFTLWAAHILKKPHHLNAKSASIRASLTEDHVHNISGYFSSISACLTEDHVHDLSGYLSYIRACLTVLCALLFSISACLTEDHVHDLSGYLSYIRAICNQE